MNTQKFLALSLSLFAPSTTYSIDALMAAARSLHEEVTRTNNPTVAISEVQRIFVNSADQALDPAYWGNGAEYSKGLALYYGNVLINAGLSTISSSAHELNTEIGISVRTGRNFGTIAPRVFQDQVTVNVQDIIDRVKAATTK